MKTISLVLLISALFEQFLGFQLIEEQEQQQPYPFNFGHVKPDNYLDIEVVDQPHYEKLAKEDLPETFEWWNVEGQNYLTTMRNQHIPQYCGSCWSFATTSALSDRIKIMRKNAFPDINIAPQVLVTCAQEDDLQGCKGGYPLSAYKWIYENEITDETCAIYTSKGWTNDDDPQICTGQSKCQNCNREYGCFVPRAPKVYGVESYGRVKGEEDMMNEIMKNGPIVCEMAVTEKFMNYTSGVFVDETGRQSPDHDVSIVGWGEENGKKYWLGRNSWGTYWGIKGMFKLLRGENNLGVENDCSWAVPKDTWTEDVRNNTWGLQNEFQPPHIEQELLDLNLEIQGKKKPAMSKQAACSIEENKKTFKEMIINQLHADRTQININDEDLPSGFDWRNKDGVNYMSWTVNQHIPQYCGSCWGQAAMSAVADRVNILRENQFPNLALSPQVLINCNQGGNCEGGMSLDVYITLVYQGVPEVTCQQYTAEDPEEFSCSPIQNCMNCQPIPFKCWAQEKYPRWYIKAYGSVSGAANMKKQIQANGPITCRIAATAQFDWYDGKSVYSQKLDDPVGSINHAISVVGWGVTEEGQEYWIGRNSWGSYWGDYGFFYMQMYEDNLAIEYDCSYAMPELTY